MNFNPGMTVWAKMRGYPYWPSLIILNSSSGFHRKGSGSSTRYFVQFLGGEWEPSWISPADLRNLRLEDVSPVLQKRYRAKPKWEPSYSEAISLVISKLKMIGGLEENRLQECEAAEAKDGLRDNDLYISCLEECGNVRNNNRLQGWDCEKEPYVEESLKGNKKIEEGSCLISQALGTTTLIPDCPQSPHPDVQPELPHSAWLATEIDEIDGFVFLSCSSLEQLEEFGGVLENKGRPSSEDMDIDDNGSGDALALSVPENLSDRSNQPAYNVTREIEIPLPLIPCNDSMSHMDTRPSKIPTPPSKDKMEPDEFAKPDRVPMKLFQYIKQMPFNMKQLARPEAEELMMRLIQGTETVENVVQQIDNTNLKEWRDLLCNVLKFKLTAPREMLQPDDPSHANVGTNTQLHQVSEVDQGHQYSEAELLPKSLSQSSEQSSATSGINALHTQTVQSQVTMAEFKERESDDDLQEEMDTTRNSTINMTEASNSSGNNQQQGKFMAATEDVVLTSGKQKNNRKRPRSEALAEPQISAYEKVRLNNIADRAVMWNRLLSEIGELKKSILDDQPPKKKIKRSTATKKAVAGARRSTPRQNTKRVNYREIEDKDWKKGQSKSVDKDRIRPVLDEHKDDPDWRPKSKNAKHLEDSLSPSLVRSKRTKPKANYEEPSSDELDPSSDELIYCNECKKPRLHGCPIHPLIWNFKPKFTIGPSRVAKNAGRGVFNDGCEVPKNAMFGPYSGKITSVAENKSSKAESGYAWELKDPETERVYGFIDPGPTPNPALDWTPFVNCASKTYEQNMEAVQYRGEIYYRSLCVIPEGAEVLVYYGDSYAKALGINVAKRDLYKGKENWKSAGVTCTHCGQHFASEENLKKHTESALTSKGGCHVLRKQVIEEEVENGIRPYVCDYCGMGFKRIDHLQIHEKVHSNIQAFKCSECEKAFKHKRTLASHFKSSHLGHQVFCPVCGKSFPNGGKKNEHWRKHCDPDREPENPRPYKCDKCGVTSVSAVTLKLHKQTVHLRQYLYSCEECGKRYLEKRSLKQHVASIHEKEEKVSCPHCPAVLKNKHSLKVHLALHAPKRWSCDFCAENGFPQEFALKSQWKEHNELWHPVEFQKKIENETPFVCPKCGKRFQEEGEVELHLIKMHIY